MAGQRNYRGTAAHSFFQRRIAICNTNFFPDYQWHRSARLMRAPLAGEIMMALLNEGLFARQMQRDSPHLPKEYIQRAMSLYTPEARKLALRLYRTTDSQSFIGWEDELCKLTAQVPTCVLWGDRDPYAPVQWAERFGALKVYHFAEYSHWLPIEAPEEVAASLIEFFAEPKAAHLPVDTGCIMN